MSNSKIKRPKNEARKLPNGQTVMTCTIEFNYDQLILNLCGLLSGGLTHPETGETIPFTEDFKQGVMAGAMVALGRTFGKQRAELMAVDIEETLQNVIAAKEKEESKIFGLDGKPLDPDASRVIT